MPKFTFVITTTFTKVVSFEAKNASEADDIIQNDYLEDALNTMDFETEYHAIPNQIACVSKYYAEIGGEIHEITEEEFDKYKLEGAKDVRLEENEELKAK